MDIWRIPDTLYQNLTNAKYSPFFVVLDYAKKNYTENGKDVDVWIRAVFSPLTNHLFYSPVQMCFRLGYIEVDWGYVCT